jgi:hypothetical protein
VYRLWKLRITWLFFTSLLLLYGYMWLRYCFIFTLCLTPFLSTAQIGTFQDMGSGAQQPIISISPSFPGPGQPFTATIEDYSGALFGSETTWTYDGVLVEGAANQRAEELMAGAAGSNQPLRVDIGSPNGSSKTVTKSINPLYIDIIIEPQTRVPDWYAGRALPSLGSQINATALLHNGTQFLNANQIVYTWQVDQNVLENGSIRGGNKVSFETPRGSAPTIILTVADLQGTTLAKRAVRMTSVQPDIEYYEKHSLYGMRTRPLQSNAALIGNVLTLQAEPFNLDARVYNRPDIAQWEINSIETSNGIANPYEITLSRSGVGGRTVLNFHVRSLSEVLQGAEDNVVVNF